MWIVKTNIVIFIISDHSDAQLAPVIITPCG